MKSLLRAERRWVSQYDVYSHVQTDVFRRMLEIVSVHLTGNILDIGSGTGKHSVALAEQYRDVSVIGIDRSSQAVKFASENRAHSRVNYFVRDANVWVPFSSVQGVVSNATIQWLESPVEVMLRFYDQLCLNGVFAVSFFGSRTYIELQTVLKECVDGPTGMPTEGFLSSSEMVSGFQRHLKSVETVVEDKRVEYSSLKSLLQTIRYTGVQGRFRDGLVWTPRLMAQVESRYLDRFGGFWATYDVGYAFAVK